MVSLRDIYLSKFSRPLSAVMSILRYIHRPRMIYGYRDRPSGRFQKFTRISSTVVISNADKVRIGDNVWIGHYSTIDGGNGVVIGEGVQIAGRTCIFTHGSQVAVRLLGRSYITVSPDDRPGYIRGSVEIGPYSFVAVGALILPGTQLGKGCFVAAGSILSGNFPDFSIIKGNPAKRIGDVRKLDKRFFDDAAIRESYFDPETVKLHLEGRLDELLAAD